MGVSIYHRITLSENIVSLKIHVFSLKSNTYIRNNCHYLFIYYYYYYLFYFFQIVSNEKEGPG